METPAGYQQAASMSPQMSAGGGLEAAGCHIAAGHSGRAGCRILGGWRAAAKRVQRAENEGCHRLYICVDARDARLRTADAEADDAMLHVRRSIPTLQHQRPCVGPATARSAVNNISKATSEQLC